MHWHLLADIPTNPQPQPQGDTIMSAATKYTDSTLDRALQAFQDGQTAGRHDIQPGNVFRSATVAADELAYYLRSGYANTYPENVARNMFIQGYTSVLPTFVQVDRDRRVTQDRNAAAFTLVGVGLISY
jgi:hypothetical protein